MTGDVKFVIRQTEQVGIHATGEDAQENRLEDRDQETHGHVMRDVAKTTMCGTGGVQSAYSKNQGPQRKQEDRCLHIGIQYLENNRFGTVAHQLLTPSQLEA